jgi:hypothetical protein
VTPCHICPPENVHGIDYELARCPEATAAENVRVAVDRWGQFMISRSWEPRAQGSPAYAACRLSDRAGKLFPQPMNLEWTVVEPDANDAQPVNPAVLVAAAEVIAARASSAALKANRAGRFDEATAILTAADNLRAMGKSIAGIDAIIAELELEQPVYAAAMAPMAMKSRHFASYSHSRGRDKEGKARRSKVGST